MTVTLKQLTGGIDTRPWAIKNMTAGATGGEIYDLIIKAHICYPPNALQRAGIYSGHIAIGDEEHDVQLFYNIHDPQSAGYFCLTCQGQCKHGAAVFFKWYHEVVIPQLGDREEKRTHCRHCRDRLPGAEENNIERWTRKAEEMDNP